MNVIDLFSGIGGFSLGLERAGMRTVAFCEIDPFCRRVLAERWPGIPCHDDVTTREFHEGEADVICGGFPCQDLSVAGAGAGLSGDRSGLYRELIRAIRVVRPKFAIVENVAALLVRGMGTVLGDMAEIGHDAQWDCIPASAVGAPHRRDRVWIVAYPERGGLQAGGSEGNGNDGPLCGGREHTGHLQAPADTGGDLANTDSQWELQSEGLVCNERRRTRNSSVEGSDTNGTGLEVWEGLARDDVEKFAATVGADWWCTEPDVGRVANGVPARVDRLRSLGNAVVPQIPELIGRAIMNSLTEG